MEILNEDVSKELKALKGQFSRARSSLNSGWWTEGFLIAAVIVGYAKQFSKTPLDEAIITAIAIGAGYFYGGLSKRMKIKNHPWLGGFLTVLILFTAAAFLVGALTTLANNWQALAVRTPLGSQIVSNDASAAKQLVSKLQTDFANYQNQSSVYEKDIDEQTASASVYQKNIQDYQAIEKLNNEEYAVVESGLTQLGTIFKKYSESFASAVSAFSLADKNLTDAENALYEAKASYYQALLDNDTDAKIEASRQAANNAVDNLNRVHQEVVQAQQDFQNALNNFSAS